MCEQAEQSEALSEEAKALVEEQAGSLYGKTHNRWATTGGSLPRPAYVVLQSGFYNHRAPAGAMPQHSVQTVCPEFCRWLNAAPDR